MKRGIGYEARLMKKLLTAMLVANFLIEGPVGLTLIFSPENFLPAGQIDGVLWARNYGVAALAIASLVFWIWPSRDDYRTLGVALGFLMFFHWTLMAGLLTSGGQAVGAVLHFILAILCTLLYFKRASWCNRELA